MMDHMQRQVYHFIKLTCCLLVFVLLITTIQLKANDGYVTKISHGGVTFYNGNNSTIRMDSEYVEITLYSNYFTVDATFWLYNTGPTKTAKVGFPHKGGYTGSSYVDSNWFTMTETDINDAVNDISTMVNDSIVPFRTIQKLDRKVQVDKYTILSNPKDIGRWWKKKGRYMSQEDRLFICSDRWLQWYVKTVVFSMKNTTKTSVIYKSRYNYDDSNIELPDSYIYRGFNPDNPVKGGTYIFGSGKSWKGNIKKSVFKIIKAEEDSSTLRIELPNKYHSNKVVQRTKLPNGELLEFYNYKPDAKDEIRFYLETKEELETNDEQ